MLAVHQGMSSKYRTSGKFGIFHISSQRFFKKYLLTLPPLFFFHFHRLVRRFPFNFPFLFEKLPQSSRYQQFSKQNRTIAGSTSKLFVVQTQKYQSQDFIILPEESHPLDWLLIFTICYMPAGRELDFAWGGCKPWSDNNWRVHLSFYNSCQHHMAP